MLMLGLATLASLLPMVCTVSLTLVASSMSSMCAADLVLALGVHLIQGQVDLCGLGNCEVILYVHTRTSMAGNHTITDKTIR